MICKNNEDVLNLRLMILLVSYSYSDSNTTVRIENLDYQDTGKYLCSASNNAGTVQSVSSVYIQENINGKKLKFNLIFMVSVFI